MPADNGNSSTVSFPSDFCLTNLRCINFLEFNTEIVPPFIERRICTGNILKPFFSCYAVFLSFGFLLWYNGFFIGVIHIDKRSERHL